MTWETSRLAEVVKIITKGTTPTTFGYKFSESGVPFLRVQNIESGTVNGREVLYIDESTHRALARSQIEPGDVLVSIAGTIGRTGIVPRNAPPMNCNQAVAIIRPSERLLAPFLRDWLESPKARRQIFGATVTGTISNLSLTELGKLTVPVPPLSEQCRIVAVLAKVDLLRSKRRVAVAQLDMLAQSIFIEMFGDPTTNPKGWPQGRLDSCCELVNGRAFKPEEWEESGTPIIRIQNLNDATKPFNYTTQNIPERFRVLTGDILFSWSGTPGTSFGCFRWNGPGGWLNQHIFNVRLKTLLDSDYFITQINLKLGELIAKAHGGVGLQHVTKGTVDETMLMIPPLMLQKEFARRASAVGALKRLHARARAELDDLFVSLQHRAFRGEL